MTLAEFINKLHEASMGLKNKEQTELGSINLYSPSSGSLNIYPLFHEIDVNIKTNKFGFGIIHFIERKD